jgi:hypothetical protein
MKITIDGVVKSAEDVNAKMLKKSIDRNLISFLNASIVYIKTLPYGVKSKTRIVTKGEGENPGVRTPFILHLYFALTPLVLHWHSSGKEVSVEYKWSTSEVQ